MAAISYRKARSILSRLPLPAPSCRFPTGPANVYAFNLSVPTNDSQVVARLDHSFSNADKINFRYFWDDSFNVQNAGLPAFNSENDWPTHNGTINETHIFTPALVNAATLTIARNTFIRGPQVTGGCP